MYKLILTNWGPSKQDPSKQAMYSSMEKTFERYIDAAEEGYNQVNVFHSFTKYEIIKPTDKKSYDRE